MTAAPPAGHRRAVALMFASSGFFTANVLLVRLLGTLGPANVWLVSCVRFLVGIALILAVYRDEFEPRQLYRSAKLAERGIIGGIGVYLMYLCVVKLGAGRATFIVNTYVIWGAFLAAWMLKEKLQLAVLIGGIAAIVGIGLLTNVFSSTNGPGVYDLVAVLTALMSAHIVVTIRQLHHRQHTSTIFAAQCVYGLIICGVPAVQTFEPLTPGGWLVIVFAGITAGAGQLTMTRAFRELPVAEGSLIQMVVPLGIAAGGMIFFGETFTPIEMVGAVLILAGSAYHAVRQR